MPPFDIICMSMTNREDQGDPGERVGPKEAHEIRLGDTDQCLDHKDNNRRQGQAEHRRRDRPESTPGGMLVVAMARSQTRVIGNVRDQNCPGAEPGYMMIVILLDYK